MKPLTFHTACARRSFCLGGSVRGFRLMARNRKADIGSARGAPDEVCDQIRLLARELVEDLQSQGVVSTVWLGRT